MTQKEEQDFEELDRLRCEGVQQAEHHCRKLKAGQVAFSPPLKLCMNQIKAWSLLQKRSKGGRVSSRYLDRVLKKAGITTQEKIMGGNTMLTS